jgi:hypothetical protein
MVLLDEDVDSFGNFYIPKSANNLLKAWLIILLALLISLRVNNLASTL